MPETKKEQIVFAIMMVICMAYAMICYNISLNTGGLKNIVFLLALKELIIMAPIAFLIETLLVSRFAHKKASQIVNVKHDNPFMFVIIMSSITVMLMCPLMSLVATIMYHGISTEFVAIWIQTVFFNFPMALIWQLFFAGPFVRWIFKKIYR